MQDFSNFVGQTNPQLAQTINASYLLKMAVALLGVQHTRSQELESEFQESGITPSQNERKSKIKNDPTSQEINTYLIEILQDPQVDNDDFFALLSAYEAFIPLQQPQQNKSQRINPEGIQKTLEAFQALQNLRKEGAPNIKIAQAALDLRDASQGL